MELNKEYSFDKIEKFAGKNDYEVDELGSYSVGTNFLVLRNNSRDIIISFVCTGSTFTGAIYKCIYSDLEKEK